MIIVGRNAAYLIPPGLIGWGAAWLTLLATVAMTGWIIATLYAGAASAPLSRAIRRAERMPLDR